MMTPERTSVLSIVHTYHLARSLSCPEFLPQVVIRIFSLGRMRVPLFICLFLNNVTKEKHRI